MKGSIISVFLLCLSLLVSCQRSSLPAVEPEENFTETQVSFIPKGVEDGAATKVEVVTSLDATGFYASAVTGTPGADTEAWTNVQFTKVGDDFVGGKYWPASNPSFRFFGSNAPLTYTAAGATVSASNTTDIVCAYKGSPVYGARNTLQFDHIYARVGAVTVSATAPYTISDVTIYLVDAKTGGIYNLYTGAGHSDGTGWSNLTPSVATDLQIYRNAGSIASGNSGTGTSPDLYVVPGEYELKASWTASVGDYSEEYETMSSTSTVSIQGGKVNTISCSLAGDASEVRFSVGVEAWGSRNIALDGDDFVEPLPPGCLPGEFSVSSTEKIHFAKGNLQAVIGTGISDYRATASEWKFAENQYDIIGNAAGNTSFVVGTTVDLFGRVGASASYDSYGLCTNTSYNNAYYGTSASDALKTDWGSIPGVVSSYGDGWFTLTSTQWNYIFTQRANASSLYGQCQITTANGTVTGMLILPDDWTKPSNCTVTPGTGAFDRVTYSATAASGASNAWVDMEAAGAVFLPAAGYRNGVRVSNVGGRGYYWSSSVYNETHAYYVYFNSGNLSPQNYNVRCYGSSVRLVI